MMNWPTAFVIAVAICAGAFLYNKPSDAALFPGGPGGVIALNSTTWIQFDGNKQRSCSLGVKKPVYITCFAWKTD